jgi:dTDP-4-amino-4,6-dideoxygalactose transaminase
MKAALPHKSSVDELAVFGALPAFPAPLHVGLPNIGNPDDFLRRARDILDRRWLTNDGPYVREFERRVADVVEVEHCVAVCNGTVALEIAARAMGLKGEVILPAFTFIATAHAFQWLGLTPVFCDVDERTHNLDPAHVEALITSSTSAIVGVHVWGRSAYSEKLTELARGHGLRLLFDAAHAFGCTDEGRPIGSRGDAEILSFHATKVVNAFEGGAILTNDGGLAARMRRMRNFGFADYDEVCDVGTNGKLPEICAAMGLTTIERLDEVIETNRRNHQRYRAELEGLPGISVVGYSESERNNYQYVVLEADPEHCALARDDLVRVLHAENVLARRYFYPGCHRMEPYRSLYPGVNLHATDSLASRVVTLPTGEGLDESDVRTVADLIRLAVENAEALSALLPEDVHRRPPLGEHPVT